jgi:hypothetical protein
MLLTDEFIQRARPHAVREWPQITRFPVARRGAHESPRRCSMYSIQESSPR